MSIMTVCTRLELVNGSIIEGKQTYLSLWDNESSSQLDSQTEKLCIRASAVNSNSALILVLLSSQSKEKRTIISQMLSNDRIEWQGCMDHMDY